MAYKDKQIMYDKNNAYNREKYDVLRATPSKEEGQRIRAAAAEAGQSVSSFILDADKMRMNGTLHNAESTDSTLPNVPQNDAPQPEPVFTPELIRKAEEAAKAAGEPLADFLSRAIDTTAQRDRLGAMLKKQK